jgi:hypothetical protein
MYTGSGNRYRIRAYGVSPMNDSSDDAKKKTVFSQTIEEFRQLGQDVRQEAQRIAEELQNPERQQQIKTGLQDLGSWAKRSAEEFAALIDEGVKKAEAVIQKVSSRAHEFGTAPIDSTQAPSGEPPPPVESASDSEPKV